MTYVEERLHIHSRGTMLQMLTWTRSKMSQFGLNCRTTHNIALFCRRPVKPVRHKFQTHSAPSRTSEGHKYQRYKVCKSNTTLLLWNTNTYVFLRTHTIHKPCISSQVLHICQQNTSTCHINTHANALTSLSPPSHIILASNSGPTRLSNVCPTGRTKWEHYRLSLTRPSWTSRTELSSETGITQCILGFSIWLYRKTDNLPNLASSTHIEPFKMTYYVQQLVGFKSCSKSTTWYSCYLIYILIRQM